MGRKNLFPAAALMGAALACAAQALADDAHVSVPTGYAALESGQFVRYKYKQEDWRYAWRQRAYVNLGSEVTMSDRFKIYGGLSAFMWYNTFPKERNNDNLNFDEKHIDLDISRGEGVLILGDVAKPAAELGMGIFPYKYNPDARNLGEYLFRSGAYPNFILGDFDQAWVKLTGFRLSDDIGSWHNDLMLTSETDIWPHFDLNLSYLTSYRAGKAFTIGAGACFTNIVSVDEQKTTPNPHFVQARHGDAVDKYIGYFDPSDTQHKDTLYYTFRSTKLMARASFNPRAWLATEALGPDELKLYAEADILGWKNYPEPAGLDTLPQYSFFSHRMERMPVMFGFNLPVFKMLDVLSSEVEWYGLKGPDSYRDRMEDGFPLPQSPTYWAENDQKFGTYTAADYIGKDDWKWSVYARKTIINGLQLTAQVARDHVRHNFDSPIQLDREEALTKPNNWWWALKLAFYY